MNFTVSFTALISAFFLVFSNGLSAAKISEIPDLRNVDDALIEKIRQTGWLEKDCNIGRISMKQADFRECVIVDAALLPPLDPEKRDHFGKDYDPEKYLDCRLNKARSRGDQTCHIYKLRRNEPEPVWPYPDAPPIQWPEPPKESVYYPGISREEYFKALCQSEAGEFIYETVENVEGIYQIRPRNPERGIEMRDPYVMEDPFGFDSSEATRPGMFFLSNNGYKFFESSENDPYSKKTMSHLKAIYDESFYKISDDGSFFRYSGRVSSNYKDIRRIRVKNIKSDFGYIWRGIKRPYDRELGIAGGEIVILDLQTNRVLGVKRGFVYSIKKKNGEVSWLTGVRCIGSESKKYSEFKNFIFRVLRPKF